MPAPTNCTAGKSFLHKTNLIITDHDLGSPRPLEGRWSSVVLKAWGVFECIFGSIERQVSMRGKKPAELPTCDRRGCLGFHDFVFAGSLRPH
jgi:hypothetical protein